MPDEKTQVTTVVKIPCEVYSRVVGFLRPVEHWNAGKQQEFSERKVFRVPASHEMLDVVAREAKPTLKPRPSGFWLPDDWNESVKKEASPSA